MSRARLIAVTLAAAVAVAGCGGDDSAEAARELRRRMAGENLEIQGIPEDGSVAGNVVELELSGAGIRIVEPDGHTSGKTGHYVVFVDREPVALGEKIPEHRDVVESTDNKVTITGLTVGPHEVALALADGTRHRIGVKIARATVYVKGPSVRASAEPPPRGQPLVVSAAVEGVTIVEPDGDTSGSTAHFAVFVDREPTEAGRPVPIERGVITSAQRMIAVPDLGGGEHEIWVVVVNGAGVPLDPMVADKLVVEVG